MIVGFGAFREGLERLTAQLAAGDLDAAARTRAEDGRELPQLAAFFAGLRADAGRLPRRRRGPRRSRRVRGPARPLRARRSAARRRGDGGHERPSPRRSGWSRPKRPPAARCRSSPTTPGSARSPARSPRPSPRPRTRGCSFEVGPTAVGSSPTRSRAGSRHPPTSAPTRARDRRSHPRPLLLGRRRPHRHRRRPRRPRRSAPTALGTNVNCAGWGRGSGAPSVLAAAVRRAARLCCLESPCRDTDSCGPRRRKACPSHARPGRLGRPCAFEGRIAGFDQVRTDRAGAYMGVCNENFLTGSSRYTPPRRRVIGVRENALSVSVARTCRCPGATPQRGQADKARSTGARPEGRATSPSPRLGERGQQRRAVLLRRPERPLPGAALRPWSFSEL